jgi:HicB family
MELTPFIEGLRRDLAAAAALGTDEARRGAELLAAALEPSVRLALMDALAAASAEITALLSDAVVEVRLTGRDPDLVVTTSEPLAEAAAPASEPDADDGTARITLRLSETLKAAAEAAAAADGLSLNGWLVAAVKRALDASRSGRSPGRSARPGRSLSGWARG